MSALLDMGLSAQQLADAIANDRRAGYVVPVDPMAGFVKLPTTIVRSAGGRRRTFLSLADAQAYDRGFNNWPAVPLHCPSPEFTGYCDREAREAND